MCLYVVVHHLSDQHQPWVNAWKSNEIIEAIQTTTEIGQRCSQAKGRNERVFVHRCGWGECLPTICCSGEIESVGVIDSKTSLVMFTNVVPLSGVPPLSPVRHQNFYLA